MNQLSDYFRKRVCESCFWGFGALKILSAMRYHDLFMQLEDPSTNSNKAKLVQIFGVATWTLTYNKAARQVLERKILDWTCK